MGWDKKECPCKTCDCWMPRDQVRDRSLKCLVDFSGSSSFLKEGGQTEKKKKKKKDMKLVSGHSRVQADEGPSNFILCSNVRKVF